MNILSKILAHKRTEVKARAERRPLAQIRQDALSAPPPRGFARALARPGLSVIAEFKRASPSAGKIADLDSALVAANYQAAGAACLSVLTDRRFFGGSDHDLVSARAACDLPVLRKDFVVDPWQIFEARALGADAVLVIMAAIDDPRPLLAAAAEVGIDALVEVHDRSELERALAVGAGLIGINNRDLSTFATDLATTEELAPLALGRALVVGESGVKDGTDLARLAACGADAALVGETLARISGDIDAMAALIGPPRPRVKICGISDPDDAAAAAGAGADYVGAILAPSRRRVSPELAREIFAAAGKSQSVAVMVAPSGAEMEAALAATGADFIQASDLSAPPPPQIFERVIPSFSIADGRLQPDPNPLPAGLIHIDSPAGGGSGRAWNHSSAVRAAGGRNFLIAGGLDPQSVGDLVVRLRPFGVDVSSGVETNGSKDQAKIARFISNAKRAAASS